MTPVAGFMVVPSGTSITVAPSSARVIGAAALIVKRPVSGLVVAAPFGTVTLPLSTGTATSVVAAFEALLSVPLPAPLSTVFAELSLSPAFVALLLAGPHPAQGFGSRYLGPVPGGAFTHRAFRAF
jgi:hypothetical protein